MHSMKKYTNVTFTKRVDHDGGRHRTARNPVEPTVCSKCGAVHSGKRWGAANAQVDINRQKWLPAQTTVCHACRQAQTGIAGGYVYLEGGFLAAHRGEIERLLRNEAERAVEDNPLARIMGWERPDDDRLVIATTNEHLAQRLGHALQKAFSGEVQYDFSHENKLTRVRWHRD